MGTEEAKGTAKELAGKAVGSDELAREGQAQQEKGQAEEEKAQAQEEARKAEEDAAAAEDAERDHQ